MRVLLSIKPEYAFKIFAGAKNMNFEKAYLNVKILRKLLFTRLLLCKESSVNLKLMTYYTKKQNYYGK